MKIKNEVYKKNKINAFSLAEILICLLIIGIIFVLWINVMHSRLDYGEKMGYWAAVKNLQKGTKVLMSAGDKEGNENISLLPKYATTWDKTGFCDRMAEAYNVVGSVDCSQIANKDTDFKTAKPNFLMSNGAAVYNLGSNPVIDDSFANTSSFLGLLFPKTYKTKLFSIAAVSNVNLSQDKASVSSNIVTSIVSESLSAVKSAQVESKIALMAAESAVSGSLTNNLCPSGQHVLNLFSVYTATASNYSQYPNIGLNQNIRKGANFTHDDNNNFSAVGCAAVNSISNTGYNAGSYCQAGYRPLTIYELVGINQDVIDPNVISPASGANYISLTGDYEGNGIFMQGYFDVMPRYTGSYIWSRTPCTDSSDTNSGDHYWAMLWPGTAIACINASTSQPKFAGSSYGIICANNSDTIANTVYDTYGSKADECKTLDANAAYDNVTGQCVCNPDVVLQYYQEWNGKCVPGCNYNDNNHFDTNQGKCVCNNGYAEHNLHGEGPSLGCDFCADGYEKTSCGTCVKKCGQNEEHSGCSSQCTCISGYNKDASGKCVSCTSNEQWDSLTKACVCNSGYHRDASGKCVSCTSNEQWDSLTKACVCNSGYHRENGRCVTCGIGKTWNGSSCVCSNSCPSGQVQDSSSCSCGCNNECSGGKVHTSDCKCVCPSSKPEETNGICHETCREGKVWNGTSCVCPSGQDEDNGVCHTSCDYNKSWNGSSCACNSSCQNGKIQNSSDCSCSCPLGQVEDDGICHTTCAEGQVWKNNQCVNFVNFYDIFVDVDGVYKGPSKLNKDVFEFWIAMDGNVYPAPTSVMADNKNLLTAQLSYLDNREQWNRVGTSLTYKQALCLANHADSDFNGMGKGYCGHYSPDEHCSANSKKNTCTVKLNLPGY